MNKKLVLFSSSAVIFGLVFSLGFTMNLQDDQVRGVTQSYVFAATEPEDVKQLAKSVVSGIIIDKRQVIDIKRTETSTGGVAKELLKIPSQIYTIQTSDVIRGEDTPKMFDVKMRGGEVDGITWNAGFADYSVGDKVVLILDKDPDKNYYEPVSEFFGVYQIQGNEALGQEKQLTEVELLEKLR